MWSQTSWSATKEACFRESSASCEAGSERMAYRCPHLLQTTVSIELSWETSAVPLIRLATLGLTNGVHDAAAVRDHCLCRRLHHQIRCGALAVLLRSQ